MMSKDQNWDSVVKRADLMLRGFYPELKTTIYKIIDIGWQIYVDLPEPEFDSVKDFFDRNIISIFCPCDLKNTRPEVYDSVIPPIADVDIPNNFEGVDFNGDYLVYLLRIKFPGINFYKAEWHPQKSIVHIAQVEEITAMGKTMKFTSAADKERIQAFLDGLRLPRAFEIVDDALSELPEFMAPKVINGVIELSNERLPNRPVKDYLQRDETLWFDKIEKVYQRNFTKSDLYFLEQDKFACFADLSVFKNLNIRNFLFLYQTVYLALPFQADLRGWFSEQKIEEWEFVELVKRGRIKVVLLQPEWRYYEQGFFDELHKVNPNGVITRRALALLEQIDIVDMAGDYAFNDVAMLDAVPSFCAAVGSFYKVDPRMFLDLVMWPFKALRLSFMQLNDKGIMGMGGIGVNKAMEKLFSEKLGRDLSFDFSVNASNIHFAHALNATYFPYQPMNGYSDAHFANLMGDFLNMFRRASKKNIKAFIESPEGIESRLPPISPIEVIELNDFASIIDFDDMLVAENAYPKSIYLMNYLASLDQEKRDSVVRGYNRKVNERLGIGRIDSEVIDLGVNIGVDLAGTISGIPYIGSTLSLIKNGVKLSKKFSDFEKVKAKIDEAYSDDLHKENIHYLTQINRVAKIRRFHQK